MKQAKILLAEDNRDHQQLLLLSLVQGRSGVNVVLTANRADLLEAARSHRFDCIVLDYNLPPHTAPEVVGELSALQPHTPCIVISSSEEQRVVVESLRLGIADFVPKDDAIDGQTLWRRIEQAVERARSRRLERRQVNRRLRQLQRQAATDPLTGIANRRYFEREIWGGRRHTDRRAVASLCLIDADHFKHINDTYGHDTGDQVLRAIVGSIQSSLAPTDILARWGGEEFIVCRQSSTLTEAWIWADDLRRAIREQVGPALNIEPISVSIGVDAVPTEELNPALITRIDRAMYLAKESGRNRVCTWPMVAAIDVAYDLQTRTDLTPRQRLSTLIDRLRSDLGRTQLAHVGRHGQKVRTLAGRVGASVFQDPLRLSDLEFAAEFHDVGKIGIPEELLALPRLLTEAERRLVNEHTRFGAELLRAIGVNEPIAAAVARHHTPYQTSPGSEDTADEDSEGTPALGDVLSVCDATIAMLSERDYAGAKTPAQALAELRANRGSQFHPDVVDVLHTLEPRSLAA